MINKIIAEALESRERRIKKLENEVRNLQAKVCGLELLKILHEKKLKEYELDR